MNILARFGKWLAVFWVGWVVMNYLLFNPGSVNAIASFPYAAPVLILSILAIAGHFLIYKAKGKIKWRGIFWPIGVLGFGLVMIPSFYGATNLPNLDIGQIPYFMGFSVSLLAALLVIFTSAWSLGKFVWIKGLQLQAVPGQNVINLALGVSLQTFVFTLLGLFGVLNLPWVLVVFILSLIPVYKDIIPFWKELLWQKKTIKLDRPWMIPVALAFIGGVAIAWISAIKPYPMGNDGATLYLALSHQLAQTGNLPLGGQSFAWSVYMSIGEIIGQFEVLSVLLSHTMGFLAAIALYYLLRNWLSRPYAFLSIAMVFLSPYFAFHSIIDEKVDLALLFFSIVIVHLAVLRFNAEDSSSQRKMLILAGWLCGFAFSIKYSFLLSMLPVMVILLTQSLRRAAGLFFILLGLLFSFAAPRFLGLELDTANKAFVTLGFISLGIATLWHLKSPLDNLRKLALSGLLFAVVALIPFSPWMVKHLQENENVTINSLLQGSEKRPLFITDPNLIGANTNEKHINRSPIPPPVRPMLMQDRSTETDEGPKNQSRYEELQRYLGFENGIWRLLSLPFDLTFSINIVGNRYVKIGFMFLGLIPLFFIQKGKLLRNALVAAVMILWTSFCAYSINDYRDSTRNADQIQLTQDLIPRHPGGFEPIADMTNDLLLNPAFQIGKGLSPIYTYGGQTSQSWSALFLGLLFFLIGVSSRSIFKSWKRDRLLPCLIAMLSLSWWLLGMGVVWYSLLLFTLLPALLLFVLDKTRVQTSWLRSDFVKNVFQTIIFLQLGFHFLLYMTNPRVGGQPEMIFSAPSLSFATQSDFSKADVINTLNPYYMAAIEQVNQNKDHKIYVVNSPLKYHIQNQDDRVFTDDLLSWYRDEKGKFGDNLKYDEALAFNQFEYVLFNLNVQSLDKTPEQRLANRSLEFVRMMVNSDLYNVSVTDNLVYDKNAERVRLPNGQVTTARQGFKGRIMNRGSFVLFKLK